MEKQNGKEKAFNGVEDDSQYKRKIVEQYQETLEKEFSPEEHIIFTNSSPVQEDETNEYNALDPIRTKEEMILNSTPDLMGEDQETRFLPLVEYIDEDEDKKVIWLDEPVKLLLALLLKYQQKIGKSFELSNKKKMLRLISQKLEEAGYTFTEVQVNAKYRSLERHYKRTKTHNYKKKRKITCDYQSELDKVFGGDDVGSTQFTLDNELPKDDLNENTVNVSPLIQKEGVQPHCSNSGPSSSKMRQNTSSNSSQKQIVEAIKEMKNERENYHNKIIKLMEAKAKRSERKLILLEKLVDILNK